MFKKIFAFLFGGKSSDSCCSCGCGGKKSGSTAELQGFVEYVVKALVDYPDEVEIISEENEEGCAIKINCRNEDRGKIIGKRGKTIMAIRSLVSGSAGRQRKRVSVDVID